MNNYRYRLEFTDDEHTVIHTFPADINTFDMKWWLRDFLAGCSWGEEQIKEILNLEEGEE